MLRLVHLSDLHLGSDTSDQNLLLSELIKDLKLYFSARKPNMFIISGDIANHPDITNVYADFHNRLILPLSEHFGLGLEKFLICPGNHDVSRTFMRSKKTLYNAIQSNRSYKDKIDLHDNDVIKYAENVSKKFFEYSNILGQVWDSPYIRTSKIKENVYFTSLNTAFTCSEIGSKNDEANLAICLDSFREAVQDVPSDAFHAMHFHHPLSHISESYRVEFERLINRYIDMAFHGHLHNPIPKTETATGTTIFSQSGALYEREDRFKGYSIWTFLPEKNGSAKGTFRTFWDSRKQFDTATNVAVNGTFFAGSLQPSDFENLEAEDGADLAVVTIDAAQEIRNSDHLNGIEEHSICETILKKRSEQDTSKEEKKITVATIASSNASYLIHCSPESGATTLLHSMAAICCDRIVETESYAYVSILYYNKRQKTESQLASLIKKGIPEAIKQSHDYRNLFAKGFAHIFVDNAPLDTSELNAMFKNIYKVFPNSRIVCALRTEGFVPHDLGLTLPVDESIAQLTLMPLDRKLARNIIKSFPFKDVNIDREHLVDEVVSRFRDLGAPLTHVYLNIYLSIIDSSPNFNPVNTSTMVDQFVENVLRRSSLQNLFRGEFDYENQRSTLAAFASTLAERGESQMSYSDAVSVLQGHLDEIGVRQDVGKLIETFCSARILQRPNGNIQFSSQIFLSYFLAIRMKDRTEFKDWIMSDKRPLRYITAIELYCGLNRSDLTVLSKAIELYDQQLIDLKILDSAFPIKDMVFDLPLNAANLDERLVEEAKKAQDYITDRDKAAKDLSEGEGPISARPAAISDDEIPSFVISWIYSLTLLSVVTKNLETLTKVHKSEAISRLIPGWTLLAASATLGMSMLVHHKTPIKIGDISVQLTTDSNFDDDVIRNLTSQVPKIVLDRMRVSLGTSKLTITAEEFSSENPMDLFFKNVFLMDIGGNFNQLVDKISESLSTSPFASRAFYNYLQSRYRRLGLQNKKLNLEEDQRYRRQIAILHANCLEISGKEREGFIEKRTNELKKFINLARLKN